MVSFLRPYGYLEGNTLTVKGERKLLVEKAEDKKATVKEKSMGEKSMGEKSMGSFFLRFILPKNVDSAQMKAHYEDGVLSLKIPKMEAKKSLKRIEIQ